MDINHPRDLAGRFSFTRGPGPEHVSRAAVRKARERLFLLLSVRIDAMSESEAHQAITAARLGTVQKGELRDWVAERFGRDYSAWKADQS